jgi:hypothetical protein
VAQHPQPRKTTREFRQAGRCLVGAGVVDEHRLEIDTVEGGVDFLDQGGDVFGFVVDRNDDGEQHDHGPARRRITAILPRD